MSRRKKLANHINKIIHFFDQSYHTPQYEGTAENRRLIAESSVGDRSGEIFKGRCIQGDGVTYIDFGGAIFGKLTIMLDWRKQSDGTIDPLSRTFPEFYEAVTDKQFFTEGTILLDAEVDQSNKRLVIPNGEKYYGIHVFDDAQRVAYYTCEEGNGKNLFNALETKYKARINYIHSGFWQEDIDVPFSFLNQVGYTEAQEFKTVPDLNPVTEVAPTPQNRLQSYVFKDENQINYNYYGGFETTGTEDELIHTPDGYGQGWVEVNGVPKLVSYKTYGSDVVMIVGSQELAISGYYEGSEIEFTVEAKAGRINSIGVGDIEDVLLLLRKLEKEFNLGSGHHAFSSIKQFFEALNGGENTVTSPTSEMDFPNGSGFDYSTLTNLPGVTQNKLIEIFESVFSDNITPATGGVKAFLYSLVEAGTHTKTAAHWNNTLRKSYSETLSVYEEEKTINVDFNNVLATGSWQDGGTYFFSNYNRELRKVSNLHIRSSTYSVNWFEWSKVEVTTATKIPANFTSLGLNQWNQSVDYSNNIDNTNLLFSGVIGLESGSRVQSFPNNTLLLDDDGNTESTANSLIRYDSTYLGVQVIHNKNGIIYGTSGYSGAYTQFDFLNFKEDLINYQIDMIVRVNSGSPVMSISDEHSYESGSAVLLYNFPAIADGTKRRIRLNKSGLFVSGADDVNGPLTLVESTTLLSNTGGAPIGSRLKEISHIRVPYRSNNNESFDCTIYLLQVKRLQEVVSTTIVDSNGKELQHIGQVREKVAIVDNNCLVGDATWAMQLTEQPTKIVVNEEDVTSDCTISGAGSDWNIVFPAEMKVFNMYINDVYFLPCSEGQGYETTGTKDGSTDIALKLLNFTESSWGKQDVYAYNAYEGGWLNEFDPNTAEAFQTTWSTLEPANSDASVSSSNQVKLPITNIVDEIYVDWGDNSGEFIRGDQTELLTHTYLTEGEYAVKIYGTYDFAFNGTGDREKLKSIEQWGAFRLGNYAFKGCSALTITAIDAPTLQESLIEVFESCSALTEIPNIHDWELGSVTNLSGMFRSASLFNQDLNGWDTRNVTNFSYMFLEAEEFNGLIENLYTERATSLKGMFYKAGKFNRSLTNWDVQNVQDFSEMFRDAKSFNQNLNHFQMTSATNVSQLFYGAAAFNNGAEAGLSTAPLSWDLTNVTEASYMFRSAVSFNQELPAMNFENCISMHQTFAYMNVFNQNLNNLNVAKVVNFTDTFRNSNAFDNGGHPLTWTTTSATTMTGMFMECPVFNQSLNSFSVGKVDRFVNMFRGTMKYNNGDEAITWTDFGTHDSVTSIDMNSMFYDAVAFNQPIGHWNTSKATIMRHLFKGAIAFDQELNSWNTLNVVNLYGTFMEASSFNRSLSNWRVDNVTDMSETFSGATSFNGDITGWNVSSVVSMLSMFKTATSFTQDIGSWNVGNVVNFKEMFYGANSFNVGIGGWNISSATNLSYMFYGALAFNADLDGWKDKLSQVTTMNSMFCNATGFNQSLANWDVSNVADFTEMFYYAQAFNQPLPAWNLTGAVSTKGMFKMATSFNQDISGWNTSTIEVMDEMFQGASAYNNGAAAGVAGTFTLNVGSVRSFRYLFNRSSVFNQEVTSWDVSSATTFQGMFEEASVFNNGDAAGASTKPLKWNTTALTDCSEMFQKALVFNQMLEDDLTTNPWDTTNVVSMHYMFDDAKKFNQDISGLNTANVETMQYMFKSAEEFNQDLSSWNMGNVSTISNMFRGALKFNNGDAVGISNTVLDWDVSNVEFMIDVFNGATAFNQDISNWDIQNVEEFGANFMSDSVPFSQANYDLLLVDWAARTNAHTGLSIKFGNTTFSQSDTNVTNARNYLMNDKNWTILDGGGVL